MPVPVNVATIVLPGQANLGPAGSLVSNLPIVWTVALPPPGPGAHASAASAAIAPSPPFAS